MSEYVSERQRDFDPLVHSPNATKARADPGQIRSLELDPHLPHSVGNQDCEPTCTAFSGGS